MRKYHYNYADLIKYFETMLNTYDSPQNYATVVYPDPVLSRRSHIAFVEHLSTNFKATKLASFVFNYIPKDRNKVVIYYGYKGIELPEYIY